tara:strand:- start:279 stop:383 length:105 start_codon:yes stop_codon:yes gene_type:complete
MGAIWLTYNFSAIKPKQIIEARNDALRAIPTPNA